MLQFYEKNFERGVNLDALKASNFQRKERVWTQLETTSDVMAIQLKILLQPSLVLYHFWNMVVIS